MVSIEMHFLKTPRTKIMPSHRIRDFLYKQYLFHQKTVDLVRTQIIAKATLGDHKGASESLKQMVDKLNFTMTKEEDLQKKYEKIIKTRGKLITSMIKKGENTNGHEPAKQHNSTSTE